MPNIAPRPSFPFFSSLRWLQDSFGIWGGGVGRESCGGEQPASPIIRLGAAGVGWGRKLRVSWYVPRSGRREERELVPGHGAAEHISPVK